MNAPDVMLYGHHTVLGAFEGLDERYWNEAGVCGHWSVRDIIAHLASYELLLADVLDSVARGSDARGIETYLQAGASFNDAEVDARRGQSIRETLDEYVAAYERVVETAPKIPQELWRAAGTLPWYGEEYSLDDWIVYQFYGHKREHAAQIAVYRDRLPNAGRSVDASV